MPVIKLQMWDKHQADEVRELLRQKIPDARVLEGTRDALGGDMNPDNHVQIDYHDHDLVDHVLKQHFEPRGHNWRDFEKQ